MASVASVAIHRKPPGSAFGRCPLLGGSPLPPLATESVASPKCGGLGGSESATDRWIGGKIGGSVAQNAFPRWARWRRTHSAVAHVGTRSATRWRSVALGGIRWYSVALVVRCRTVVSGGTRWHKLNMIFRHRFATANMKTKTPTLPPRTTEPPATTSLHPAREGRRVARKP